MVADPGISAISDPGCVADWNINNVDADWDDEPGQVELRIEAQVDLWLRTRPRSSWSFCFM
jgi:hypothetical protein